MREPYALKGARRVPVRLCRSNPVFLFDTKLMIYRGSTDISGVVFEYHMIFSDEPYSISGFLSKKDMNHPNFNEWIRPFNSGNGIAVRVKNINFRNQNPPVDT